MVLDNASSHRSHVVRDALPSLWAKRIYLSYLPPYSPELNDLEPVFRVIKHDDPPERHYPTAPALQAAMDVVSTNYMGPLRRRLVAGSIHSGSRSPTQVSKTSAIGDPLCSLYCVELGATATTETSTLAPGLAQRACGRCEQVARAGGRSFPSRPPNGSS